MKLALTTLLLTASLVPTLRGDEGMWTFDNIPAKKLQAKVGFVPDKAWLDHLRQASLRFPGGSGSFVSKDGLVLTNHHVGHSWIQRVSTKDQDFVKQGFVAADRTKEIKVPGLELMGLVEMVNVTAEVEKAVPAGADEKTATKARQETLAKLTKAHGEKTKLRCEPVNLYQGGEYWIYAYKVHSDVRLVMCPEYDIAAFGKDDDNFTWPRHDLDFSLFRVYEDGKPHQPAHHLTWSQTGVKFGDATFTSGHPGTTNRLHTLAQMRFARDYTYPANLKRLEAMVATLRETSRASEEGARQVSGQLMGVENALKSMGGVHAGLKDAAAMAKVEAAEKELRAKVQADPKLRAEFGQSWDKIEQAMAMNAKIFKDLRYASPTASQHLNTALGLLRLPEEAAKPAEKRLAAYADLEVIKSRVLRGAPMPPEAELQAFEAALKAAQTELGASHWYVKATLAGRTPAEAAKALLSGTKLGDAAVRKALVEGGKAAVTASQDPLMVLARTLDPGLRTLAKAQEEIQAVQAEHNGRIAKARFKVYGKDVYPDATFTLRLSYGTVDTYPTNGTLAQPFTTFAGLFDRAAAWGPTARWGSWSLPRRWQNRRGSLELTTPYNFISSNDIIGGNSGSPVVNAKGELVGLAFDGNIESLPGSYYFDASVNRCLSVDARGILEALDKVFDAFHLVDELKGK